MSSPKTITLTPEALDRDGISAAETLAGAGNLTIGGALASGGSVTFTQAQHVTIYAAGDESGVTFTVTGTDRYGAALTEDITGPNATTVVSTANFQTVTQVAGDGATSGDVEVGVDGTCESQWYVLNYRGADSSVAIGCVLGASANLTYAVQHTYSDIFAAGFQEPDATAFTHSTLTGETTDQDGVYDNLPRACRLAITAHTAGSVSMTVIHEGS